MRKLWDADSNKAQEMWKLFAHKIILKMATVCNTSEIHATDIFFGDDKTYVLMASIHAVAFLELSIVCHHFWDYELPSRSVV
jgi:hypothetical protein